MAKSNLEKLNALSSKCPIDWMKVADELEKNEAWLKKSAEIAANVLHLLRVKDMSQQTLADLMGVKPQYISRIVKGNANLTLETITKLEDALDHQLVNICDHTETIVTKSQESVICEEWKPLKHHISSTILNRHSGISSYRSEPNYYPFS